VKGVSTQGSSEVRMPEGPEVRRQADGLRERLTGQTLVGVEVLGGKWLKKAPAGLDLLVDHLPLAIDGVDVKGKSIQIRAGAWTLWSTLGMGGYWSDVQEKHSHLRLSTQGPTLWFTDVRRFGNLICMQEDELRSRLRGIGPDLLNEDVDAQIFRERLAKKSHWNITKALMDQRVVSGIGNYLKAEILYRTGISPWRDCGDLSEVEVESIRTTASLIMRQSYARGGATIQSYRDVGGQPGEFSFHFKVYGQTEDPEGRRVIRELTPDGRTTHWVPEEQK